MSAPLTFGSVFSGIGGLDLGMERAGMVCKWQVEIDPYCRAVLAKHWPDVPRHSDIRDVDFTLLEPVNLICGGFPCQPFSVAGKREGEKDERYLWPEFARAIGEARPRVVLLENVPGLLSVDTGRVFGRVLADLASLGFDAEWDCIPAAAVGASHLRYRLFVVAYAASSRCCPRQPGEGGEARDEAWRQRPELLGRQMADSPGLGCGPRRTEPEGQQGATWVAGGGGDGAHAHRQSTFRPPKPWEECLPWEPEPDVGRVANGVPARVDRLRGLGNAVVPQVAEWIGRRIMAGRA